MEKTMTEARADALMEDGFHCSQCVFPYAAFRLGMDRDEALRLSAGLGGGCFHGDSCGAVTGAAMALSIVFGFDRPNAEEADKLLIEKVHEFQKRFLEENGSADSCSAATTRLIPMPSLRMMPMITAHAIVRRPAGSWIP